MKFPDLPDVPRRNIPFRPHDPADGPRPRIVKHTRVVDRQQPDPLEAERSARREGEELISALDGERHFLHQERALASQTVSALHDQLEHVLGRAPSDEPKEEDQDALFRHRALLRERAELVVRAGNRLQLRKGQLDRFREDGRKRPTEEALKALRAEVERDLDQVREMQERTGQVEAEARFAHAVQARLESELARPVYLLEQLRSVLS